ncbi:sulfatase [Mariniphaga sp.]|uniref:sulfatase n=1 Tax=Mariniphaga sp. TaxID=1954475 RepID=UPI0035697462
MKLLPVFLAVIFLASGCKQTSDSSEPQARPNIVFILADDLGWSDLPAYGNTFNEAPHIDKLAAEGVRFTNAYAACPVCSPTRASIQSGQYPARVGVTDFITGHWRPYEEVIVPKNRTQYLPEEIVTIGEALKNAGYATGYFGKWHLGGNREHHPLNQGYDEANVGQGYYHVSFNPPRETNSPKRLSELLTDFGESFIENNKDNPFFLFVAHYDVHVQLDADQELIDKYLNKERKDSYPGNAVYAAMIEHLDLSVGRLVAKLEETGLEENTIVIFYSDNGGLIGRFDKIPLLAQDKLSVYENNPLQYIASSNAPLRAEKGTVYEGGIREPLIVKWPAKIKKGRISEALVTSVDFYPTLLEIAEAETPQEQILDGKSLLPELLENKFDPERAIFWHYPVYHHDVPAGAVRMGDWKLIENQVSGKVSLFNLRADISEAMDLSELYPDKTAELKALLQNWQKEVNAEFPVPNPEFDATRRYEWGVHPDRRQ